MGVELALPVAETKAGQAGIVRPPRLPFVLSVGVTGHRADVLPAGSVDALRTRIRDVLLLVAEAGRDAASQGAGLLCAFAPRLRFVSPIADGADQIAAEVALDLGWELQAVLPFGRAEYRASLANHGARERFDTLARARDLHARAARRQGPRARRLCDDWPRDGRALRYADRRLGRASAARARGDGRGRAAGDHSRNGGHPFAAGIQ